MYSSSRTNSTLLAALLTTTTLFLFAQTCQPNLLLSAAEDSSRPQFRSHSLMLLPQSGQQHPEPAPTTTTPTTTPPVEVPDFLEPIGNHTVALGRDAQLACRINKLGSFRTAWLRVEDKGILTIHNNVITRNYRVGLINNDDEGKNFILTIKNVQPSDRVSSSS